MVMEDENSRMWRAISAPISQPGHDNVLFRGKPLRDLSRDEAIEALEQALTQIKAMAGPGYAHFGNIEVGSSSSQHWGQSLLR